MLQSYADEWIALSRALMGLLKVLLQSHSVVCADKMQPLACMHACLAVLFASSHGLMWDMSAQPAKSRSAHL